MMRYRVELGPRRVVFVVLDQSDPDGYAEVTFEGHPDDVDSVKDRLSMSHGIDGRLIEARTTPMDLDVAMRGKWLGPIAERVAGEDVVARYERKPVK